MTSMHLAYVLLISLGGGAIQASTGFGFGLFAMIFLPLFMPFLQATALSNMIVLLLQAQLAIRYRKHIDWRAVISPAVIYLLISTGAIYIATRVDTTKLTIFFGLFMLMMSVYFIASMHGKSVTQKKPSMVACSTISGIAGGFFGVGGPPIAIYYLAYAGENKAKYLGTTQCFFLITTVVNTVTRSVNGIVTTELLYLLLPGIVGQLIGMRIGSKIVGKMSMHQLQMAVYVLLGISGVHTLLKQVLY